MAQALQRDRSQEYSSEASEATLAVPEEASMQPPQIAAPHKSTIAQGMADFGAIGIAAVRAATGYATRKKTVSNQLQAG